MKRKHSFQITVAVDASRADTAAYIREAVRAWGGGFESSGPFFGLSARDVTLRPKVQDIFDRWAQMQVDRPLWAHGGYKELGLRTSRLTRR